MFSFLCLLLTLLPGQQFLADILDKQYDAVTLSAHELDSILNPAAPALSREVLRYDHRQQLFRRSWEADWYLYDTVKHTRTDIGRGQEALVSPNGKYIVYVQNGKPWIYKLDFHTQVAMTNEDSDSIFGGIADWLYEEEFGVTRLFAFSPDSRQVAFIRLDTRGVNEYAWQEYLSSPFPDMLRESVISAPTTVSEVYPNAGSANSRAQLCVYDIQSKGILTFPVARDEDEDFYLPRLAWRTLPPADKKAKDAQPVYELLVQKVNRDQTRMELIACNPRSTVCRTLYRESSEDAYQDYELFDSYLFLPDGRFVVLSERDGFRRLYLHEEDGTPVRMLTPDEADITAVYGYDPASQTVYYEAAPTPMTRQAYALSLRKGTVLPLTAEQGTHHLTFSSDFSRAIDCFQTVSQPNRYTLYQVSSKGLHPLRVLEDNRALAARWKEENHVDKHFFTFTTERGDLLNGWMLRPSVLEKGRKYPSVVLQYSGPASQRVLDRWRIRWEYFLVEQGYLVFCIDARGTDCRGRQFRNATYMRLGEKEAEDIQSLANLYIRSLSYADPARIALGGWSYGGYQTIRTMEEQGSAYRCGFAIAPVTDWRLYDTGYTERYMRRPQVNPSGYQEASVLGRTRQLQGNLLLISGLADDNVHQQNTWLFVESMVQAGKQFEMQIYPDDNHFLRQRSNYLHLHQRIMLFLEKNL